MSETPDRNAMGLTGPGLDALRYDGQYDDPWEVAGTLRELMPAHVRVLDVGCGTGSVTVVANRDKGNDVVAIEPDAARAAVARSRGIAVEETFLDDRFIDANGPFDVVLSSDVLEHMPAPAEALRLFGRALKPGGLILISVPNVAHWSVRLNLLMGRFDHEPVGIMDATHLRWFTTDTIRALVEDSGFRILQYRTTAGVDLPVYHRSLVRFVPTKVRSALVRRLSRAVPRLFTCQHVIMAQRA